MWAIDSARIYVIILAMCLQAHLSMSVVLFLPATISSGVCLVLFLTQVTASMSSSGVLFLPSTLLLWVFNYKQLHYRVCSSIAFAKIYGAMMSSYVLIIIECGFISANTYVLALYLPSTTYQMEYYLCQPPMVLSISNYKQFHY